MAVDILLSAQDFSNRECTRMNAKVKRTNPTADLGRWIFRKPPARFYYALSAVCFFFVFIGRLLCNVPRSPDSVLVIASSRNIRFTVKVHNLFAEELVWIVHGAFWKYQSQINVTILQQL